MGQDFLITDPIVLVSTALLTGILLHITNTEGFQNSLEDVKVLACEDEVEYYNTMEGVAELFLKKRKMVLWSENDPHKKNIL